MKRLIKRILRAGYRRTEFLRRPIRNELEVHFKACVTSSFDEVRIAMDGLVAEVYRLQDQVAALRLEVATLRQPEPWNADGFDPSDARPADATR